MHIAKPIAAALFAAGLSSAANAVITLAPARYNAGVRHGATVSNYSNFSPASLGYSDSSGAVSADVYASPRPTARISGNWGAEPFGNVAIANAMMTYQFAVLSGVPGTIHLLIDTNATAGGYGNFFADAEVDMSAKDGSLNLVLAHAHASSIGFNNVFFDGGNNSYAVLANKIYSFRLTVSGNTKNYDSAFSALADPVVRFDPHYGRPAGTTLAFSPNIPAAVPEPGTWAMLLCGFGLVGALSRRRQPAVAA